MRRNSQRGEGKLKSIIALAIIAGIIYFMVKVIPVYVNNYELEDAMKSEARFASVNRRSAEEVRNNIYAKIKELEIPARPEDIKIVPIGNNNVRITVTYTVVVDFPGYQMKLNFSPTADNMSV